MSNNPKKKAPRSESRRSFSFVNITQPGDSVDPGVRSTIRSHASRKRSTHSRGEAAMPVMMVQKQSSLSSAQDTQSSSSPGEGPSASPSSLSPPPISPPAFEMHSSSSSPVTATPDALAVLRIHFFHRFIAAESPNAASQQRWNLHFRLWNLAPEESLLQSAILLLASSHRDLTEASFEPSPTTWLRYRVAMWLNMILADPNSQEAFSDQTLAAIIIYAGNDFCYAGRTEYMNYMNAAKRIVQRRGGTSALEAPMREIILAGGWDLPNFTGLRPYFSHHMAAIHLPRWVNLPSGFLLPRGILYLTESSLLRHELTNGLMQLSYFAIPGALTSINALLEMSDWFCTVELPCALPFNPFQSPEDDAVVLHAHLCLRLGSACFARMLSIGQEWPLGGGEQLNDSINMQIMLLASQLKPDLLCDTLFAELLFWSLTMFRVYTSQTSPLHVQSLQQVGGMLNVDSWHMTRGFLLCYLYSEPILNHACEQLWLNVMGATHEAGHSWSQSLAPEGGKRTRFDRNAMKSAFPGLPELS